MNHYFFVAVKDTNELIVSDTYVLEDDKRAINVLATGVHAGAEILEDRLLTLGIYKMCGEVAERIYYE